MEHVHYVELGSKAIVTNLRSGWLPTWKVGLFQNDFQPDFASNIGDITPADFSGYAGLQTPANWTTPATEGERLVTRADAIAWTHSGGPQGNWIFGYYAVDAGGVLLLAQRFENAPTLIDQAGVGVTVTPTFSQRSEF